MKRHEPEPPIAKFYNIQKVEPVFKNYNVQTIAAPTFMPAIGCVPFQAVCKPRSEIEAVHAALFKTRPHFPPKDF